MHLVTPLVSGIAGAENGTVHFYRRGASGTYIAYYTSFEGDGATTPTAGVTLDSNGGGVFYVNEETICVVKNSSGTTVRSFVAGASATAVEVISRSFTGTDYETGATGASKPITLASVLDLLYTSFGTRDFNVLFGGVSTSLQTAIAGVGTLFYNVKSPAYGALGDGSTNDTSAIQAALDAASAAGGGTVFFPAGTYRITATLTVAATVSLLGVGPSASIITMDVGPSTPTLTMSVGLTYQTTVSGLRLKKTQANNGNLITATAGRRLLIDNCYFDASIGSTGIQAAGGSSIYVWRSTFLVSPTAGNALTSTSVSTSVFHCFACNFVLGAAAGTNTVVNAYGGSWIACEFDASAMASGTVTLFQLSSGVTGLAKTGAIIACNGGNPVGGTVTVVQSVTGRANDGLLTIGNRWGSAVTISASLSDATKATYYGENNQDRARAKFYVADDTAALSVSPGVYSQVEVERTTTGNQTLTFDAPGPVSMDFTLVYNNNQGAGGGTITMAGPVQGLTTFTVNANKVSHYFFRSIHTSTHEYWSLVGSDVNQAP